MLRFSIAPCFAMVAAAAFVLTPSREARADLDLGLDLNLHTDVDGNGLQTFDMGVDGRIGARIPILWDRYRRQQIGWLIPELQGGWTAFGAYGNLTGANLSAGRIMGGARLVFGQVIQGGGFAHAGLAFVSGVPDLNTDASVGSTSQADFTFDVGGVLDFRLSRNVFLGAQVAFNRIQIQSVTAPNGAALPFVAISSLDYVTFGPHLQLFF
jgi:hypothetical protein